MWVREYNIKKKKKIKNCGKDPRNILFSQKPEIGERVALKGGGVEYGPGEGWRRLGFEIGNLNEKKPLPFW